MSLDPCAAAELLPYEQARARILEAVHPLTQAERLPLRAALGRVLAEELVAPFDLPAFRNAAMDGYALRSADCQGTPPHRLRCLGAALAGHPYAGRLEAGTCIRIYTGAPLPDGADSVVMEEYAREESGRVFVEHNVPHGQWTREPGEEMRCGQPLLQRGERLEPAHLGLLATAGLPAVMVLRRPRILFFSTGDELRPLGSELGPGQIYDSNRHALWALLQDAGLDASDGGVIGDDPEALTAALRNGARHHDALITTGGASMGAADHVHHALSRAGRVDLWKIAMKPGKPLAFGSIGEALFFGLPGNPVSVLVTFRQMVLPALRRLAGQRAVEPLRIPARLACPWQREPGRTEFVRAILRRDESGALLVEPTGAQGSHRYSSMTRANCLIVVAAERAALAAGETVDVEPLSVWL